MQTGNLLAPRAIPRPWLPPYDRDAGRADFHEPVTQWTQTHDSPERACHPSRRDRESRETGRSSSGKNRVPARAGTPEGTTTAPRPDRVTVAGRPRLPDGHLSRNCASRFSMKADMPSFWSSVANSEWNTRRSNSRPSHSRAHSVTHVLACLHRPAAGGPAAGAARR